MPYNRLFRGDFHRARQQHRNWPSVVSEGDSWFSYELRGNILDRLDDPMDTALPADQQHWALLRLEQSGDEIAEILSGGQRAYLRQEVFGVFPNIDALLFSAGGNDIIGPDLYPLLRDFEDGELPIEDRFDLPAVDRRLDRIRLLLLDLIDLTAESQPGLVIYMHGYDTPTRLGEPARLVKLRVAGPWLLPQLERRGYGDRPDLQHDILEYLVDRFNDMLARLDADHETFEHVDVRGFVGDDWADEIHPNRRAAQRVAKAFENHLRRRLPGLVASR